MEHQASIRKRQKIVCTQTLKESERELAAVVIKEGYVEVQRCWCQRFPQQHWTLVLRIKHYWTQNAPT